MTQQKQTKTVEYTQQDFKLLVMFFANMKLLEATIQAAKGTPFFSTSGKRLIGQLIAELMKHIRMVKGLNPDILMSEQFNVSKMLITEFLQTVVATDTEKFLELAALLKLYREGNVRFEREPKEQVNQAIENETEAIAE